MHIHSTHSPGRTIGPITDEVRGAATFYVHFRPNGGHSRVGSHFTDGPDRTNLQRENRHATA